MKTRLFNLCVLPTLTYGAETDALYKEPWSGGTELLDKIETRKSDVRQKFKTLGTVLKTLDGVGQPPRQSQAEEIRIVQWHAGSTT